ncbi:type III pantothenate kinase [Croceibacter atlanticus]|jgi:type III pantothenate kinase|uniref:Type III pantothenate kinase n=1 Tax=Croceibacter atlanticus (strain ATCC BAA-628 / JCM 21780 / CIP 108009 / IAM 15332 / KCTC 12090 / HTCC2559) TaxID=216432 RepID=A3U6R7_CROAH|nr:type III pantothenate kinase [Croceibacter atlanticus]EAP87934.1 putative transcription regulator [Croceibacter atlanticus HTCC2559]
MNLIIDIGNSRTKLAVFEDVTLKERTICSSNEIEKKIKEILENWSNITHSIISNTSTYPTEHLNFLEKYTIVLQLNQFTSVPYTNNYNTPETLGLDRIGLVAGSAKAYSNENVLIIDAGTCITYDFIDSTNKYHGGSISPGLQMRFKAMHEFTAKLPLLKATDNVNLIGKSTSESMQSGAILGTCNEIDGFINRYKEKYPDLTVIFTGGDADFLSKRIKNSIFANSNFLLEGLNHILEFNKDT